MQNKESFSGPSAGAGLRVGCHLSISKGLMVMGRDALSIGANVCQFFCRNPRSKGKLKFKDEEIAQFRGFIEENDFGPLLAHSPFVINAASIDPQVSSLTEEILKEDLEFISKLPGAMYNIHPGNYLQRTPQEAIATIAQTLNECRAAHHEQWFLLETMAGKGTEIGRTFQELREIIDRSDYSERLGVCLDTCHVWDGGYDVAQRLDEVLAEFDQILGLERLRAIHLNDTLNDLGAHKDRHARLGEGKLGVEAIAQIINHPQLRHLPFYLETPNELPGYAREIALLRQLYRG